ncbi:hypothetical protein C8R30_12626 [Nitrosomonas nitrosa]|jgi:hypothetical protein|uniref:Uncharacterized protein n=1 Tax=Nitrosomonas nitrosa TaxID=52442 RepID=A0A1I4RGZ8_9PROT|nr:hypothetical protein [Nitrosomonas nitrosa]MCO6433104.1 hypothetical protein [Nitrosomonas nitrosa]PTQ92042.1 hypothetical protein C8R30_12626 [Nitrosomonas nitrosa]SFM51521.1 hypothetical protein SAMN05421880_11926 [Nitrosomonas nitrosa]HNP50613.1 hypothetical protein [Nitrosomonas nitrosa]
MIEKFNSTKLTHATIAILGQPPCKRPAKKGNSGLNTYFQLVFNAVMTTENVALQFVRDCPNPFHRIGNKTISLGMIVFAAHCKNSKYCKAAHIIIQVFQQRLFAPLSLNAEINHE